MDPSRIEKRKRGNPNWIKGRSANPAGRPKVLAEIRDLAREHTADAIAALAQVCRFGRNDSARVSAAVALLDRGYGRPMQSVHATPYDPSQLTDGELAEIIAAGRETAPKTQH